MKDLKGVLSEVAASLNEAKSDTIKVKVYTYDDNFNELLSYHSDNIRGVGVDRNGELWVMEAQTGAFPDSDRLIPLHYNADGVELHIDGKHINTDKARTHKVRDDELDNRIGTIKWFNKFKPYRKGQYSNS